MGARWKLVHGDCLEVMAKMREASVDAVVSDPPYGLAFMGKAWDHGVPGVPFWAEALRVAKPGAHLLAFGGTRTFHRLAVAIEDAGWEVRDCFSWLYGTGFPKSHNLDGAWDGWGTALKPAWEPIIVARKPLVGTVARNVGEFGTGALNIDECRIESSGRPLIESKSEPSVNAFGHGLNGSRHAGTTNLGRWPANVILDEDAAAALDAQTGTMKSGVAVRSRSGGNTFGGTRAKPVMDDVGFGDSGGASRFFYVAKASRSERWEYLTCDCEAGTIPAWVNEVQSRREPTGVISPPRATCAEHSTDDCECSTSSYGSERMALSPPDGRSTTPTKTNKTTDWKTSDSSHPQSTSESTAGAPLSMAHGSSPAESAANGSPSTPSTSTSPPKAGLCTGVAAPATFARSWRGNACGSCGTPIRSEGHATVKPVDVMRWLCRLVTPPNGIVLDPFTGSGTTGVAALQAGFRFVGIEKEDTPEHPYVTIARARIAAAAPPEPACP